ncbi:uncharacterized protein [Rutidosis leptorrhynchoides]|uniref:uncharacterized protein n=1 Tax=Rutidosis leptorrhynchoides TaxID=125765 RepID=UPI003A98F457
MAFSFLCLNCSGKEHHMHVKIPKWPYINLLINNPHALWETTNVPWAHSFQLIHPTENQIISIGDTHAPVICREEPGTKTINVEYHNQGPPTFKCPTCNATMWYDERHNKPKHTKKPTFSICCQNGKILLPKLKSPPPLLMRLLDYTDTSTARFREQIRNEATNHMLAFLGGDSRETVDETLTNSLITMLDEFSAAAQAFRMARDWASNNTSGDCALRLLAKYQTPISIMHQVLVRWQILSLATLATYPLLFPYGEIGYHENIPYHCNSGRRKTSRGYITMREFYCYRIQQRENEGTTLLRGGRLFQQYLVDAYTEVEEQRLKYLRNHQNELRTDLYNNVCDATPEDINDLISAEIPNEKHDPEGYKAVTEFMLHGPCGGQHKDAPCMIDNQCSKHFPKSYYSETTIDEDGYPNYRRRNNGVNVNKGKTTLDNSFVVPYNRYLLIRYNAHIHFELCNRSRAIKYLFKYLNKGSDRATIVIQENVLPAQNSSDIREKIIDVDEIKNYLDCRYLSPCEAVWRLFSYDIHFSKPSVIKLSYHLPNQQSVTLHDSQHLPALLQRPSIKETMFTQWF